MVPAVISISCAGLLEDRRQGGTLRVVSSSLAERQMRRNLESAEEVNMRLQAWEAIPGCACESSETAPSNGVPIACACDMTATRTHTTATPPAVSGRLRDARRCSART